VIRLGDGVGAVEQTAGEAAEEDDLERRSRDQRFRAHPAH